MEVQDGSKNPPGGLGQVKFLPGGPGGVGRPSRRSGRGREALPEVREGLGGPNGVLGRVGTPSRRFGTGQEAHP